MNSDHNPPPHPFLRPVFYVDSAGEMQPIEKMQGALDGWWCERCERFEDEVSARMTHGPCEDCGLAAKYHYGDNRVCQTCTTARERKRNKDRFDKARKITEAEYHADPTLGPCVSTDTWGSGDFGDGAPGVWDEIDTLRDYMDSCGEEPEDMPTWVCPVKKIPLRLKADELVEEWVDDGAVSALQEALDTWAKAHPHFTFEEDRSVVIMLDKPKEGSEG